MIARQTEITPCGRYNAPLALDYLRTSPAAVLERVDENGTYRRALTLRGRDVLLSLRPAGATAHPRLLLDVRGPYVDSTILAAATDFIRRVFSLDVDPGPFVATVSRDPVFAALAKRFDGLRPVLIADPYEALLWAILGQQVNVSFARTLKRTLVDLCGRRLSVDGQSYPLLPRPDDVAALDPDVLRARHFSRQKAAYITGLSQAIASGALDLAGLAALPFEEAVVALTRFQGVGRWTAEYVLMRGLGAQDSIPAADLGLRAIVGRAYGLERTATEAEVRAYAAAWAPWRGWAAFYWWLALQTRTLTSFSRPGSTTA